VQRVRVIPDSDSAGRAHAQAVARSCHAKGLDVRVVELPDVPEKGDLSDYLAVHTKADLLALIKAAPPYRPPSAAPAPIVPDTNLTESAETTAIALADLLRDLSECHRCWGRRSPRPIRATTTPRCVAEDTEGSPPCGDSDAYQTTSERASCESEVQRHT
jgi:hypothetical protein